MKGACIFALVILTAAGNTAVDAQFSSDLPGVPRASVPLRGGHQNRTAWTFDYLNIPGDDAVSDSLAVGMRISFGQSYRIGSRWEAGYDFALADGVHTRTLSTHDDGSVGNSPPSRHASRGAALYGLRLGAKFRPLQKLSPEGFGWEAAVGVSFQPSLEPVFGMVVEKDTVRTGGLALGEENRGLVGRLQQRTQYAGFAGYRSRRIALDAALLMAMGDGGSGDDPPFGGSPIAVYTGVNARAGGLIRLTPGIAVGATWWGTGAPPWEDQLTSRLTHHDQVGFAPLITFGSKPEAGLDVMVISPGGSYANSVRLYLRGRSTR